MPTEAPTPAPTNDCPVAAAAAALPAEFECGVQTGATSYATVPCRTYCLVAYMKNTEVPHFVTSEPICTPVGCAVLRDRDGRKCDGGETDPATGAMG